MSAELVDPFAPAMTQERYDDLRDIAKAAVLDDKAFMPAGFWHMFAALGAIARNLNHGEFAANTLEEVALSAWDNADRYDPQGGV